MMNLNVQVKIQREGKWVVISSPRYGITTQGKTTKEAILNFSDAFETCYEDADWRAMHDLPAPSKVLELQEPAWKVNPIGQIAKAFWQGINPHILQPSVL